MNSWLNAWHVNPSVNRDYDFIDGLRGIAILMVLGCHHIYINSNSGPAVQFAGAFFAAGGRGVYLFFALSGFLISWPVNIEIRPCRQVIMSQHGKAAGKISAAAKNWVGALVKPDLH